MSSVDSTGAGGGVDRSLAGHGHGVVPWAPGFHSSPPVGPEALVLLVQTGPGRRPGPHRRFRPHDTHKIIAVSAA